MSWPWRQRRRMLLLLCLVKLHYRRDTRRPQSSPSTVLQYVGCIITLLGASVLAPAEVVTWWLANYVYLMHVESVEPADVPDGDAGAGGASAALQTAAKAAATPRRRQSIRAE